PGASSGAPTRTEKIAQAPPQAFPIGSKHRARFNKADDLPPTFCHARHQPGPSGRATGAVRRHLNCRGNKPPYPPGRNPFVGFVGSPTQGRKLVAWVPVMLLPTMTLW